MNTKKLVSFAQDISVLKKSRIKQPKWWQFWIRPQEKYKYTVGFVTNNFSLAEGDIFLFERSHRRFMVSKVGLVKNSYNQVEIIASSIIHIEPMETDEFRPQNVYVIAHSQRD